MITAKQRCLLRLPSARRVAILPLSQAQLGTAVGRCRVVPVPRRKAATAAATSSAPEQNSRRWASAQGTQQVLLDGQASIGAPSADRLQQHIAGLLDWLDSRQPPKFLWRTLAAVLLGGQALQRIVQGAVGVGCNVCSCLTLWQAVQ